MDDLLPADVTMLVGAIERAVKLHGDAAAMRKLQVAAMAAAKDYSWTRATKKYVEHFLVNGRLPVALALSPLSLCSSPRFPSSPPLLPFPTPFLLSLVSLFCSARGGITLEWSRGARSD